MDERLLPCRQDYTIKDRENCQRNWQRRINFFQCDGEVMFVEPLEVSSKAKVMEAHGSQTITSNSRPVWNVVIFA
jgi:hypothetical protein